MVPATDQLYNLSTIIIITLHSCSAPHSKQFVIELLNQIANTQHSTDEMNKSISLIRMCVEDDKLHL